MCSTPQVWLNWVKNHIRAVPEKIHTHSMEGHQKFLRGGGSKKSKFIMYNEMLNWNFIGGGGGGVQNQKNFLGVSMNIFWNYTLSFRLANNLGIESQRVVTLNHLLILLQKLWAHKKRKKIFSGFVVQL